MASDDDDRKPGPISMGLCLIGGAAVLFCSLIFLPAAELLPAQVNPEKRVSGESCVRIPELMNQYGVIGLQMLQALPKPKVKEEEQHQSVDVVKEWKDGLVKNNGDKYGADLAKNIEKDFGSEQNLKTVLDQMNVDKNFVYNAYALFLGLALLAGAIAIQAMGRWGSEEKTILPVKK